MIETIIIIVCSLVLAFIFFHRWHLQKKINLFGKMGIKVENLLAKKLEKEDHEVTVKEMIPDPTSIEPKLVIKGESFYKRAEQALRKGDLKEAEKLLIQSISMNPSHVEAHARLGSIYLKLEQHGKAELFFRKLVVARPDEAVYHSNLGLALFNQERLQESREFYEKAVELDDKRAGRFFSLARVNYALGEYEKAFEFIHRALELDSANIDYGLTLASWYLEKDLVQEAKTILEAIVCNWPENQNAIEMLAELEKNSGLESAHLTNSPLAVSANDAGTQTSDKATF